MALGLLTLLSAGVVSFVVGVRIPEVHDEFAYLLMGETFQAGRITNPSPRFWQHLETFHVLLTPTYTGKYPPGQGLFLAIGFLIGHPIVGVWLSAAFMVSATTWMLAALLPRKWALWGGFLIMAQLGVAGYWAQSYWGGALAAGGGALVYGSLARGRARPGAWPGIGMGVGLMLLANSRPLEGLIVSIPALAATLYRPLVGWQSPQHRFWLGLLPVLALGFSAMAAYNRAVTGNPFHMPYQEYREQYESAPLLLTTPPEEDSPSYRHPQIEAYWANWGRERHLAQQDPRTFVETRLKALARLFGSILGFGALGLLFLRGAVGTVWVRLTGVASLLCLSVVLLTKGAYTHYLAPAAPLLVFLAVRGWQQAARERTPTYKHLAFAAIVGTIWMPIFLTALDRARTPDPLQLSRVQTEACLGRLPFGSVVITSYRGFTHRGEWIRNSPDPWASKIVWARAMDREADSLLVSAVPNRAIWHAGIDASDPMSPTVSVRLVRAPTIQTDSRDSEVTDTCISED